MVLEYVVFGSELWREFKLGVLHALSLCLRDSVEWMNCNKFCVNILELQEEFNPDTDLIALHSKKNMQPVCGSYQQLFI